jgi:putative Holliday junction resolvase
MRVLALDPGERRVGIAISDPSGTLARPLQTLVRTSKSKDFAAIAALVAEHDISLVVVGRPLSLDGTEGPQAQRVARYAQALADHLPIRVISWDERYTTATAEEILRQNRKKRKNKGELDAVAAAVILQSYLDSQPNVQEENGFEERR